MVDQRGLDRILMAEHFERREDLELRGLGVFCVIVLLLAIIALVLSGCVGGPRRMGPKYFRSDGARCQDYYSDGSVLTECV